MMIHHLRDRYYWYNTYNILKDFLQQHEQKKILLYGYPKSGNTWLRFLLYNYFNLLIDQENIDTISYTRLNKLQNNIMDQGTTFNNEEGFPIFYRTHKIYKKAYDLFSPKIFIHRNPLDTLISGYYFYKNRSIGFQGEPSKIRGKLFNIDFYVSYKIDSWIDFFKESIKHADIVVNYSNMRMDCVEELSKLILFLDYEFNDELVRKAVSLSSFGKIKEMGQKNNQIYGNGPNDGTFNGEFTRSGEEGQFYNELKQETIALVFAKFTEFKDLYPNIIE